MSRRAQQLRPSPTPSPSPGPWRVSANHQHAICETFGIHDADGMWVAKVHPLNGSEDVARAEANANLLSAAPDLAAMLLEALEALNEEEDRQEGNVPYRLNCGTCEAGVPMEHSLGCRIVGALKKAGCL